MIQRKHLILLALVATVALAGCANMNGESDNTGEELANDTGTDISDTEVGESYIFEIKLTEENQNQLVRAQPPRLMEQSLERQNLINRYEYLNDENNVHHVYVMDEGQVVSYFVAQGKVSSVNSKLTNDRQVVEIPSCGFDGNNGAGGSKGPCYKVVESPQMDGSYGENGEAIFFFTTSGEYVETSLDYVVSEEPRNIQDEPILIDQPGDGNESSD